MAMGAGATIAGGESSVTAFTHYDTRDVGEAHDAIAVAYYDLRLDVTGPAADFLTSFGEPGVYHVAVPFAGRFTTEQGRADATYATEQQAVLFDPEYGIRIGDRAADSTVLTVKIDKLALHRQ